MLKRESRLLGLSGTAVNDKIIIASVVFRGSLWLDGVAAKIIPTAQEEYHIGITNLVKSSKQFSQLHAIIISKRLTLNWPLSLRELARAVKLPVVAIYSHSHQTARRRHGVERFALPISGGYVTASIAGTDKDQAEKLYAIGCSPHNKVPEAVRIADLFVEELRCNLNRNFTTPNPK